MHRTNFTTKTSYKHLAAAKRTTIIRGALIVAVFVGLGFAAISYSHAATLAAASEAEAGSLSGNQALTTDPAASGGKAVAFGKSASTAFIKGMNNYGGGAGSQAKIKNDLHASWLRLDFDTAPNNNDRSKYNEAVANGLTVLPIIYGSPATYVTAFPTIKVFEWGNEPYFGSGTVDGNTPEQVARSYKTAVIAMHAVDPSITLLLPMENVDDPNNTNGWGPTTVAKMFQAVPDLAQYIGGVAVHPYGRIGNPRDPTDYQFERISDSHDQLVSRGVNAPYWITEVGWTTNDFTGNADAQITTNFQNLKTEVSALPWVKAVFIYEVEDQQTSNKTDREMSFGLYHDDLTAKPQAAVVQQWFASLP